MSSIKKKIKSLLGFLAFSSRLYRLVLRDRAVIVAFHRISDSAYGTSLNCTPASFDRFCRFFGKYFSVLPLSELLGRLRSKEPIAAGLVITFDDGYKDNYETAAPLLKKYDLPATFFVATNFIGSQTIPFWDKNDGFQSRWMDWNEVAALRNMGFDVGGHTLSHADLGSVGLHEAREEIYGCREALEKILGAPIRHFAYPFGGVKNIRTEAKDIVAESGFECCLSCHGGVVSPSDDVYALYREPINTWSESPYQYGFELLMKVMGERA